MARPAGLKLAARWAVTAARRILRITGTRVGLEVASVEIVEAALLREELGNTWTRTLEVDGRRGIAVISIAGQMVEALATSLLGGSPKDAPEDKAPSPTALRLFGPVGDSVVAGLVEVWEEEQSCHVRAPQDSQHTDWRRAFGEGDVLVVVTLAVGGVTRGSVRLLAQPDTLCVRPLPISAVRPNGEDVRDALGQVEVDVKVELGKARITMSELTRLRPGDIVSLDQFVDDLLPVQCAGVVKGHGRALVSRGVMAVEIADLSATGNKAA